MKRKASPNMYPEQSYICLDCGKVITIIRPPFTLLGWDVRMRHHPKLCNHCRDKFYKKHTEELVSIGHLIKVDGKIYMPAANDGCIEWILSNTRLKYKTNDDIRIRFHDDRFHLKNIPYELDYSRYDRLIPFAYNKNELCNIDDLKKCPECGKEVIALIDKIHGDEMFCPSCSMVLEKNPIDLRPPIPKKDNKEGIVNINPIKKTNQYLKSLDGSRKRLHKTNESKNVPKHITRLKDYYEDINIWIHEFKMSKHHIEEVKYILKHRGSEFNTKYPMENIICCICLCVVTKKMNFQPKGTLLSKTFRTNPQIKELYPLVKQKLTL